MVNVRIALALTGLLATPHLALAGPLAQTARGIDNAQSSSSSSDSSSKSSSDSDTSSDSSWYDDDSSTDASGAPYGSCGTCSGATGTTALARSLAKLDVSAAFRASAQKVMDSDGAFRLRTNVLFNRVGFELGFDHYYEHISEKGRAPEDVKMNLIEATGLVRLFDLKPFRGELRGGFIVAASTHFTPLPGGVVGAQLSARAHDFLTLRASGRAMFFDDEIRAYEGSAGILAAKFIWMGYRALKFDVGPVIEGPELGLAFEF
jgi:hypothetical protein